jgi:hypothetical protein
MLISYRAHPLLFRPRDWRRQSWPCRIRTRTCTRSLRRHFSDTEVVQRYRPQDRGELPRIMYRREGRGQCWQATTLQGFRLPSCDQGLHDPGRVGQPLPYNIWNGKLTGAGTSQWAMGQVARAFTEKSSKTRTLRKYTKSRSCSAWQTLDPVGTPRRKSG